MQVDRLAIRLVELPLVESFVTSRGAETTRRLVIVEAHAGDVIGYGEASPLSSPVYTEETHESIRHMIEAHLAPIAFSAASPRSFASAAAPIRRNTMAKAAVEAALWDLAAKKGGVSLATMIGGVKTSVDSGIALGVQSSIDALLERIDDARRNGYRRIKVKIRPEWDLEPIRAIRSTFGDIPLAADANGAYESTDIPQLKRLDPYHLLLIEQPFDADELLAHARLQKELETPVCLDETLSSARMTRQAIELGCCRAVNVKIGRVGGLCEALAIHELCQERGVPLWCGGLLESGIGRAHNLALASLSGFSLPPDLSASDRYFTQDVISPPMRLNASGRIDVPTSPGLGFAIDKGALEEHTKRLNVLTIP